MAWGRSSSTLGTGKPRIIFKLEDVRLVRACAWPEAHLVSLRAPHFGEYRVATCLNCWKRMVSGASRDASGEPGMSQHVVSAIEDEGGLVGGRETRHVSRELARGD